MFKAISITLSEDMIQEIDQFLFNGRFSSRSEFFRRLIHLWQMNALPAKKPSDRTQKEVCHEFSNVNLEFGIPPDVIEAIKEKVKKQI